MTRSRISPSNADRWMQCPGSPNLIESLGIGDDRPVSRDAAEGTFAHSIRALVLKQPKLTAFDFIDDTGNVDGFDFTFTFDMAEHLQPGIERLRREAGFDGQLYVEWKHHLAPWMPESWGTMDACVVNGSTLIVDDLKFGMSPVAAETNRQLMIYALAAHKYTYDYLGCNVSEIVIRIDQPRAPGGGSSWSTSIADLLAFGEDVRAAARATRDRNAPLRPSDTACKWCPAKDQCPAIAAHALTVLQHQPDTAPVFQPPMLTPEQRSNVLRNRGLIESWLESLYAAALDDALQGQPVPGMKAVEGRRGNRQWIDDPAVEQFLTSKLGDAAWTKKLISPAAIDKLLDKAEKAIAAAYITQSDGKPLLVDATDKRPAISAAPAFDALD